MPSSADPGMRIRFGASAGGGTFFPGPMVDFGVEGRVGWQFTNILGLYGTLGYNQGLWIGGSIKVGSGSAQVSESVSFVNYTQFGVEGEAILGNHFFVALGPKIAKGGWGYVGQEASGGGGGGSASQAVGVVSGWFPAVGTKIGVGFGKPNPGSGRRNGFTMMLDTTFVFASGGVRAGQSAGTGGATQVIAPYGGIGIAPMLMFGFESR